MGDRRFSYLSLSEMKTRALPYGFLSEEDYVAGCYEKILPFVHSEGSVTVIHEDNYSRLQPSLPDCTIFVAVSMEGRGMEGLLRLVSDLEELRERHQVAPQDIRLVFGFDA